MGFEKLIQLCLSLFFVNMAVQGQHSVVRFNKEEINEIVKMHNDLRRSIYNAANMRELTWNEAVAMAASDWGTECEYVTRPDNQWGQNMNYFYDRDYHKPALDLFKSSFESWSNETRHYDYRRYRFCGQKNVCSYVQLIAADVEQVGCSVVKCPRLQMKEPYSVQTHAKMLVCFYTPWVDISNREVFIPQERCAACPKGTTCVDNLCSARFSGREPHKYKSIGESRINIGIGTLSGKRPGAAESADKSKGRKAALQSPDNVMSIDRNARRHRNKNNGQNNIIGNSNLRGENRDNPGVHSSNSMTEERTVIYTPNNRVVPFPGKKEARVIRRIEKYERKLERRKKKDKKKKKKQKTQAELVQKPDDMSATKESTNSTQAVHSRKKRQTSYEDAIYLRRLEYHRYLRELREREILDRERRRRHEEELRRRRNHHRRQQIEMMELRRMSDDQRRQEDERERRRLQRLRERRRRQELMALLQSEGELTGEEQFNTISAHNLLRRADGARELSWSSHLEKWAKYVIRCETEYPGPITCYTNFGKANRGQEIYNVVYEWGAEGDDLRRPLRYGCRTPYDQSMCNHDSIIREKSLTQMACAAKNCGLQRQLTCIYNSG